MKPIIVDLKCLLFVSVYKPNLKQLATALDENPSKLIDDQFNISIMNKTIAGNLLKKIYTNVSFTENIGAYIRVRGNIIFIYWEMFFVCHIFAFWISYLFFNILPGMSFFRKNDKKLTILVVVFIPKTLWVKLSKCPSNMIWIIGQ